MTDHPLTETDAVEMSMKFAPSVAFQMVASVAPDDLTEYARAAFDAGREHERTNPEDDRPWEPLGDDEPLSVGDEVRQERAGVTTTAVVARVDKDGDPRGADDVLIGLLHHGTWHVRRPAQDLPTKPGTVIVPADGHEYIEATVNGSVRRAREAILGLDCRWHGVWRGDSGVVPVSYAVPELITPGTWKVEEK
ncbi:hypothetical protein M3C53_02165 [Micrococcus luteus]|nr:hypothetical protein [Micrococcus luteus]